MGRKSPSRRGGWHREAVTGGVRLDHYTKRQPHPTRLVALGTLPAQRGGIVRQALLRLSHALAWSSRASVSLSSTISAESKISSSWVRLVALTIGAVIAGCATSQASEICAGVAL